MKISCIALDLDRTTLNSAGKLSAANRQAIEQAIARGIHVVVASGRALRSLPQEVCEIEGIRYAITSNGAAIYDLHTGECLKQYKMTMRSVSDILRRMRRREVVYEAFIDGKPYAWKEYVEDPVRFGATAAAVSYVQSTRQPVEDMMRFLQQHIGELDCLDIVVKDEALKREIWRELDTHVEDIYITSSIRQLLEICYKDCGKHSGAAFLLQRLGLKREALAAFGDADNDEQLLQFAAVGIAVENAAPGCKQASDRITHSNDEDGVAYGIHKLLAEEW